MIKPKFTVSIDDAVSRDLDTRAERFGMTKNTLLAAVAYELSRVPPDQVFNRIARLTEEERSARAPSLMGSSG